MRTIISAIATIAQPLTRSQIRESRREGACPDDERLHDGLIDADPRFLDWTRVQACRNIRATGYPMATLYHDIDGLPSN